MLSAALALTIFGTTTAQTANHYVRAGGSGAQDGFDWNNASPTLPAILVRGDTYYLAKGTYPGRSFDTPPSGSIPITIKKATRTDHGTQTGWDDALSAGAANFSHGWVFASSHWIVDGQTGGGAANGWNNDFGIKITETNDEDAVIKIGQHATADNITIRHVDMQGKGSASTHGGSYSNDGLAVYGSSNVVLSYFRMAGIGRCPFFVSPRNLLVEHGWVQSFHGSNEVHSEVASIWAFAGPVGDVSFRNNLFTDIQSTGGIMWDNSSNPNARLLVDGNVFYKEEGAHWERANGLVGGWTGSQGEQFRNATVRNNSFINVDQESLSSLPNVHSGNVAYSNVFFNSSSPNFAKFEKHNQNIMFSSTGPQSQSDGLPVRGGDPFVGYKTLDFRLKAPWATLLSQP